MIDKIIQVIITIVLGTGLSIYVIIRYHVLGTVEGLWFILNLIIFLICKRYKERKERQQ